MKRSYLACLTWSACRDERRIVSSSIDLRGYQLFVGRSGKSMQGRQHAILGIARYEPEDRLPPEYDLTAWLIQLWGPAWTWPRGKDNQVLEGLKVEDIAWELDPFARMEKRGVSE